MRPDSALPAAPTQQAGGAGAGGPRRRGIGPFSPSRTELLAHQEQTSWGHTAQHDFLDTRGTDRPSQRLASSPCVPLSQQTCRALHVSSRAHAVSLYPAACCPHRAFLPVTQCHPLRELVKQSRSFIPIWGLESRPEGCTVLATPAGG